jgi:hypothetical protein
MSIAINDDMFFFSFFYIYDSIKLDLPILEAIVLILSVCDLI